MQDLIKEDSILRSFFDFLFIEKGLSSNTIISYKIDVNTFIEWINKKDLDYLSYLIDWCHSKQMGFHVTELNYWLRDESPNSIDVLNRQSISYSNIVNTLIAKRNNGLVTLNLWGIKNKKGPGNYPKNILSIYDKDLKPAQAFYSIKKSLIEKNTLIRLPKE